MNVDIHPDKDMTVTADFFPANTDRGEFVNLKLYEAAEGEVSIFLHDKASLYRLANAISKAAANMRTVELPVLCEVCGFDVELLGHSMECPKRLAEEFAAECARPDEGEPESANNEMARRFSGPEGDAAAAMLTYTAKVLGIVSKLTAAPAAQPDGPVGNCDGYTDGERAERDTCSHCNGSGEGMHEGAKCSKCGGDGEIPTEEEAEAAAIAQDRAEDAKEEAIRERLEDERQGA